MSQNKCLTCGDSEIVLIVAWIGWRRAQHLKALPRASRRITVAGDKGYDTAAFVASCRTLNVTPHVAQNDKV